MTTENQPSLSPPMRQAVDELRAMVERRYPGATFRVTRGEDDPHTVHLVATVDVDDTDELVDEVLERVLELQLEQGLPIHVIPVRPLSRALKEDTDSRHRGRPRIDWGAATKQT